jgi:hypothetical protein
LRTAHLSILLAVIALLLLSTINSSAPSGSRAELHLDSPVRYIQPPQSTNDSQTVSQSVQVGAWGSRDSIGNRGVQVEIQTSLYILSSSAQVAFWVGDILDNNAFVQFGYLIPSPGYYCLDAHIMENGTSCQGPSDNIGVSDARWFWAYFPNARNIGDWFYGFGSANSAGANGTSHIYSIVPSSAGDLTFVLDGVNIYASTFPTATSSSPAHLVAERTAGPASSRLGPVKFSNLAYLGNDSLWHGASSLTPIDGCGYQSRCETLGYGVETAGANEIIAGSNISARETGQFLWERQSTCPLQTQLTSIGSVGAAPLNVTFLDAVSSPYGSFKTDWWFGDGSHQNGNTKQTVTYRSPGYYTPFVRVLDSAGCLSEASGKVSVAAAVNSTLGLASGASSFVVEVIVLYVIVPRNAYGPLQ